MHRDFWRMTSKLTGDLFVIFAGIALYMALSHFGVVSDFLGSVFNVISPFVWGLVIAYLLDGVVRFFEQNIFKTQKSRLLSVAVTYVLAGFLFFLLMSIVIPQLAQSVGNLIRMLPTYSTSLTELISNLAEKYQIDSDTINDLVGSYDTMVSQVTGLAGKILPQLVSYSVAIGSGLVTALTAIISSIYMLLTKETLQRQAKKCLFAILPLNLANGFLDICTTANRIFGGFITGKLLDSFIIGVLCFIGSTILSFPYALLISVIVGVTNVIPVFGPFIGAIPCGFLLLIVSPVKALEFLIFILVLQQLDGNVIGPRILGDSTGLSPLWVLVAIILGQGLFGVPGMVIGVPTFAVIYTLVGRFLDKRLAEKGISKTTGIKESSE